ncbi:HNH endonuclease [Kitasatospora sp. NPDC001603]|uniref:HNH endonuclease n=1 Tax=Kitasatospora sp. NPDC001603 TaxID=3154388 RepID=UPI003324BD76
MCKVHRWFAPGRIRCTFCGVRIYCPCGQAELEPAVREGLKLEDVYRRRATLDHVKARVLGGPTSAANLAVACLSCNCSKADRSFPGEWVPNRDANTFVKPGRLPDIASLSRTARRIGAAIEQRDSDGPVMTVADFAQTGGWRPEVVHRALESLLRSGALCVFAYPCGPSSRHFLPVENPSDAFAGVVWVEGWS